MKTGTLKSSPKRKLLFYMPGLVDGGAERVWALLASYFAGEGHEVILAVDFAAGPNAPDLDERVRVEPLGQGHLANIRALAGLMKRERPDIALSAIAGSNVKILAARLLARNTMPVLIAYHGFEEYRTGRLSWLSCISLPILSRMAARTIAVSDGLKASLITRWRAAPHRTIRIYNPVDIASRNLEISKAELARRDRLILAVGRLSREKNLALLIEAAGLMTTRSAEIVILGEGPERAALQAQIARLGLEQGISMPGYCAAPEEWYGKARCLAVPSDTESFGNVVVEALAHGLPVVATDCAGPREILQDGRFGTLIPRGQAGAMAKALDAALADPGEPGPRRQRAAEFSARNGCKAYETLIEEVLEEVSRQP
jgi:glycosyltransferase involved in cell wall biosynthesis